jgi:hypothetical protein
MKALLKRLDDLQSAVGDRVGTEKTDSAAYLMQELLRLLDRCSKIMHCLAEDEDLEDRK